MFRHVPYCKQPFNGHGIPTFLANFTRGILDRRSADIGPPTGKGPVTIGSFTHEQNLAGVIENRAANVKLRICITFFADEKLCDLGCIYIGKVGQLSKRNTLQFLIALPVEYSVRVMQTCLCDCQQATRLCQPSFRQFSRCTHGIVPRRGE